jgi:eukaryotic-like serine/threonine-protein kinase
MKECPTCNRELKDGLLYCPFDGHALVDKPRPDKLIGALIDDKYRIEEKIGEGGMGTVYRATHAYIGSTVAVKVLHAHLSSDTTALERFRREARAAGQIKHPNAVAVTDFGVTREGGLAYLVMEFLEGTELRARIKGKPLTYEETLEIVRQTCSAIRAAHSKGIVHRDLKPENIWLLKDEEGRERVKVLDFGIAKLKAASGEGTLTQQGMIVGTPYYMSPEQCTGGAELDARSDIYSMGVIAYEMLTGDVPFRAATAMGVVVKHINNSPPRPSDLRRDIPAEIDEVILKALAKKREDRQDSASALALELETAMVAAGIEVKALTPRSLDQTTPPDFSSPGAHEAPTIPEQEGLKAPTSRVAGARLTGAKKEDEVPSSVEVPSFSGWLRSTVGAGNRRPLWGILAAMAVVAAVLVPVWLVTHKTAPNIAGGAGTAGTGHRGAAQPVAPEGMVYVPSGKFIMGNDRSSDEADKPEHEVEVPAFFIDQYEVTNEQYQQFLNKQNAGYPAPDGWDNRAFPKGQEKYPVTGVTFNEARDYAAWAQKRLPKEQEWEYAARGAAPDRRIYPWGNDFSAVKANTKLTAVGRTSAVDRYPGDVSPFKIFDMGGNAQEWIAGLYQPYEHSSAKIYLNYFIVRGGSYQSDQTRCAVSHRTLLKADQKGRDVGFRCAKDVPQ